eukprot:10682255-Alexandrium_andersonii.AAC.1
MVIHWHHHAQGGLPITDHGRSRHKRPLQRCLPRACREIARLSALARSEAARRADHEIREAPP